MFNIDLASSTDSKRMRNRQKRCSIYTLHVDPCRLCVLAPCCFPVDPCWLRVNPCYICVDACCSVLAPWSNRVFRVGSVLTSCWRRSLMCSSVLAPYALRVDKSSCYFFGNRRSFSCRITPDCLKRSSATIRDDPCETVFIRLSV